MQHNMTMDQMLEMRGSPVYSSDGEKIGQVEEIYIDEQTQTPEWIGIGTGFFGTKRVLVPTAGTSMSEDGFTVPYSKDQVKDAPDIDEDEISQETERELSAHYGLDYSERRSDTGLPEESAKSDRSATTRGSRDTDEGEIVRSEEELHVGTERVRTGTARLRKWVETEPVEMDVELQREKVQVHREPVNQVVTGAEFREEEIEVPLHAEEAVVEKKTVAKERISVDRNEETTHERVTDEVRKERVAIEGDIENDR